MDYREIAPHPGLAPYVRTYWTLAGGAPDLAPQPVLPDGCTELIVHRGRPFWRHDVSGAAARQTARLFVGQMLAPVVLAPDGHADIVAIRFEPWGAFALLGGDQRHPADAILDVDATSEPWLTRATRHAESADSADDAVAVLEAALLGRLDRQRGPLVDPRVAAAARAISHAQGAITVDAAATAAGTSGRHLERLFLQQIGTTPKRFARVLRFQAAAADIAATPAPVFAGISADRGYYDQAHMIREFTSLAGQSPAAFQRSLGALTRVMLS